MFRFTILVLLANSCLLPDDRLAGRLIARQHGTCAYIVLGMHEART